MNIPYWKCILYFHYIHSCHAWYIIARMRLKLFAISWQIIKLMEKLPKQIYMHIYLYIKITCSCTYRKTTKQKIKIARVKKKRQIFSLRPTSVKAARGPDVVFSVLPDCFYFFNWFYCCIIYIWEKHRSEMYSSMSLVAWGNGCELSLSL